MWYGLPTNGGLFCPIRKKCLFPFKGTISKYFRGLYIWKYQPISIGRGGDKFEKRKIKEENAREKVRKGKEKGRKKENGKDRGKINSKYVRI